MRKIRKNLSLLLWRTGVPLMLTALVRRLANYCLLKVLIRYVNGFGHISFSDFMYVEFLFQLLHERPRRPTRGLCRSSQTGQFNLRYGVSSENPTECLTGHSELLAGGDQLGLRRGCARNLKHIHRRVHVRETIPFKASGITMQPLYAM